MIRWLSPLFASAALAAAPVHAHGDGGAQAMAPPVVSNGQTALALAAMKLALPAEMSRFAGTVPDHADVQRQYGPFRVVGADRVEMVGATDRATPAQFAALLREHPGIRRIDMVECPGTHDDRANLRLGRMIRAAGIATHVPGHGSVRSGAVDLFLAGRERVIHNGAEFAVHSWRDAQGREAHHFAADAAPNRHYLNYYREMGMDPKGARAFYAFTNSVPHSQALWLEAGDMRDWLARANMEPLAAERPRLADARPARSSTLLQAFAVTLSARRDPGAMALLDLSVLGRSVLPRAHPATGALDLVRRL